MAMIRKISASAALVIQSLRPVRMKSLPSSTARVWRAKASLPEFCSVRA